MKRLILISFFGSLILISGVLSKQNISHSFTSGPPAGYSGAPGENNCTACHSGTLNGGTGTPSITTNIPMSGYVGGETYTITASIAQSSISKFGFQMSVENQSNSNIGTLVVTNSTTTQITSTNYINHKTAGTAGNNSKTWTFNWTAPCAGQDTAYFYGAFNAANSNSQNSGDNIYTRSIKINENIVNSSDSVNTIALSDVGDNYNGSDLKVQFDTPDCETRTGQYRIIVVKLSSASTFDTTLANQVNAANYTVVATGNPGITKNISLSNTARDADGDLIRNNQLYKVFVLSTSNTLVNKNALVESPNSINLMSPMASVSNIKGFDIDDKGNGADLEVTFDSPPNEGTVAEYRSITVKVSSASSFTVSAAQTLATNQYKISNTGNPGSTLTVNFASMDRDSDGDLITVNVPYRIFVLNVADGVNSIQDSLLSSSTDITLGLHATSVTSISVDDVDSYVFNNRLFVKINKEIYGNSSYRIFDVNGRKIADGTITEPDFEVNLSNERSMIILQINLDGVLITERFIK